MTDYTYQTLNKTPEIDENGLLVSSFDYYHKSMHRIDKIYLMKKYPLVKGE
jgi:hypothetical protein